MYASVIPGPECYYSSTIIGEREQANLIVTTAGDFSIIYHQLPPYRKTSYVTSFISVHHPCACAYIIHTLNELDHSRSPKMHCIRLLVIIITFLLLLHFIPLDKGESQLNLKKSVLMKVVRVLESPKVQEMELAQQVKEMLSETSLPRRGDEGLQIIHGPSVTRYF